MPVINPMILDSVSICKTINVLIEVMKDRGHLIIDRDNPECSIDAIKYDPEADELYCVFADREVQ